MALITNCAGSIDHKHNIYALTCQFTGHGLHARTTHTYAGTDRVQTLIIGFHRNFGTHARITRCCFDFQQTFFNFRHFQLK